MPVRDSQFALQAVVIGRSSVRVLDDVAEIAVREAKTCSSSRSVWIGAGRYPSGNQVAEARIDERLQRRISIEFLELSDCVIANVAHLRDNFRGERVLDSEVPLLRVRIMEVMRYLDLAGESRITSGR